MQRISPPFLLLAFLALILPAVSLAQGWQHVGNVQKVDKLPDGVELTAGKAKVRVTVFREGLFRVRVAPAGGFPTDSSWAVIESPETPAVKIEEGKDEVRVTSGTTVARIHKSPLLIDFLRDVGDVLVADDSDLPMGWENGSRIHHVEYRCLRLAGIHRPALQNHSVFYRIAQRAGLRNFL